MLCENYTWCPIFGESIRMDKGLVLLFKKIYCKGDKSLCARYKIYISLGRSKVPYNLYPNMNYIADELLSSKE